MFAPGRQFNVFFVGNAKEVPLLNHTSHEFYPLSPPGVLSSLMSNDEVFLHARISRFLSPKFPFLRLGDSSFLPFQHNDLEAR